MPISSHPPHLGNLLAASKGLAQQTHLHPGPGPVASHGMTTHRNEGSLEREPRNGEALLHTRAICSPTSSKLWPGRHFTIFLFIQVALRRARKTENSKLSYDWFNFFFQQEKKE